MQEEKRDNVVRYMKLFYSNFLYKEGNESESKKVQEDILNYTLLDTAHEKLFLARLYEGLANNYSASGEKDKYTAMLGYFYKEYPQLLPFSGLKMKVKLNITGPDDDMILKVKSELKDCNINWTNEPDNSTIIANINFEKKKDKYQATYFVQDTNDKTLIPDNRIVFKDAKGVGKELALRIFGVNGPLEFENQN